MKKIVTIIAIVLAIAVGDLALTYNNFIVNSDYFVKNDFEITQYKHSEKVWDKVFFGNSVVISAYMEDKSSKGYVNLGLDYGVVTDLWKMIEKKHINIGSELVMMSLKPIRHIYGIKSCMSRMRILSVTDFIL